MSYVLKENALCIEVRNGGEYGAFYLRSGTSKESMHWCELVIQSTFGTVGYFWSHMGCPAYEFLSSCDRGYMMGKLFGARAYVFDMDKTIIQLKKRLFQEVRETNLRMDLNAREIYDGLCHLYGSEDLNEFYRAYEEHTNIESEPTLTMWCPPGEFEIINQMNPQAVGLWEQLWPDFLKALKEYTENPKPRSRSQAENDLADKVINLLQQIDDLENHIIELQEQRDME